MPASTLSQLISMSRRLDAAAGRSSVIGHGNTAARIDAGSFYVKATGTTLSQADPDSFVKVDHARAIALLESDATGFREPHHGLADAKVDLEAHAHPSRETLLHAVCLEVEQVQFVARTQPTAIHALTCSAGFPENADGRLTPDDVAVCGPRSLALEYACPGIDAARALRRALREFCDAEGTYPRVVLLQNNGMIALGDSAEAALAITAAAVEAAKVLALTHVFDGPRPLPSAEIERLLNPDDPFEGPPIERV